MRGSNLVKRFVGTFDSTSIRNIDVRSVLPDVYNKLNIDNFVITNLNSAYTSSSNFQNYGNLIQSYDSSTGILTCNNSGVWSGREGWCSYIKYTIYAYYTDTNNIIPNLAIGTAEKTATTTTKVITGFRPDIIAYYNVYVSGQTRTYNSMCFWERYYRPNKQVYSYNNQVDWSMPSTDLYGILSVDNDGFTVNRSGGAAMKYIDYIAIKI